MRKHIEQITLMWLLAMVVGSGMQAAAQRNRVNNRQIETVLTRLETRSDNFRQSLTVALNRSNLDNTQREDFLNRYVAEFEQATDRLQQDFRSRNTTAATAQEVLNRAAYIDSFMRNRNLSTAAERDWDLMRSDLDLLASYYNVRTRWNDMAYNWPAAGQGNGNWQGDGRGNGRGNGNWQGNRGNRLTGTYQLDATRSDNVSTMIERATVGLDATRRERMRNVLTRQLESPERLALERRGQAVTIASSTGRQTTLTVDNTTHYEGNTGARATLNGEQLVIYTESNRNRDYSVTFDPLAQGSQLRVTRTVTVSQLNRPIVITSFYNRTSDVAQLDIYDPRYDNRDDGRVNDRTGDRTADRIGNRTDDRRRPNYSGNFYIPNGTRVVAALDTTLDTKRAQEGERFTMTVRSPNQYNGAIIEGFVTNVDRAGRLAGRADMTLNFERIRLTNGRSYDFAANIDGVRTPGGDNVRIDEGRVEEENSQTERTVTRTGIGAALGAIIGAIAGGGQGAAIGAAVGAGAGAGSVYVTGRDDLELLSGTEFTLSASSPRTAASR